MEDSKFSLTLVFLVGNYFVTFFIIGLIAAGISLLKSQSRYESAKWRKRFFRIICYSRLDK